MTTLRAFSRHFKSKSCGHFTVLLCLACCCCCSRARSQSHSRVTHTCVLFTRNSIAFFFLPRSVLWLQSIVLGRYWFCDAATAFFVCLETPCGWRRFCFRLASVSSGHTSKTSGSSLVSASQYVHLIALGFCNNPNNRSKCCANILSNHSPPPELFYYFSIASPFFLGGQQTFVWLAAILLLLSSCQHA